MAYNFPYLKDSAFLKKFDKIKLKEQFVKIVVLTFDTEQPIAEIQGKVTGGSISLNGDSAMRRTCNINLIVDDYETDLIKTNNLLSINKKVEILIGLTNNSDEYQNYPIIWFLQGTYIIMNPNISHSTNGISISLTLHDKMALLNGESGGTLPASVSFHEKEDVDEEGNIVITHPTIYQIIQELVNHFGGQSLNKIIISDVDSKIKKVMKWTGSSPLYLYQNTAVNENFFSTDRDYLINHYEADPDDIQEFLYGDDIGYTLVDFTYPGELIGTAGNTVVTILDQIKNLLGNYEYFYDIDGNFRFQQIKNYLNTPNPKINQITTEDYLVDFTSGKSVFSFEDAEMIQNYSNAPQYQQIKNDFMVWGKRKTANGTALPIRYHLVIDDKPQIGNTYYVFFYTDPDDGTRKAKRPFDYSSLENFPQQGMTGQYYYARDTEKIYQYIRNTYELTSYTIQPITTTDYRTELYLAGVASEPFGQISNYYYTELKNEWPKLYDVENQEFFEKSITQSNDIDFFLDFIDNSAELSEFNVTNIGRRTVVINDDDINCVFVPDYPNIVIIENNVETTEEIEQDCIARNQPYSLVDSDIYSMLSSGGSFKSAYDRIKTELYQYINYSSQVSLTTIPIFYLEPNIRITINHNQIDIH